MRCLQGMLVRAVLVAGISGAAGELSGFTLANGYTEGDWPENAGGGIFCSDSSPRVIYNRIIGSAAAGFG